MEAIIGDGSDQAIRGSYSLEFPRTRTDSHATIVVAADESKTERLNQQGPLARLSQIQGPVSDYPHGLHPPRQNWPPMNADKNMEVHLRSSAFIGGQFCCSLDSRPSFPIRLPFAPGPSPETPRCEDGWKRPNRRRGQSRSLSLQTETPLYPRLSASDPDRASPRPTLISIDP